MNDVIERFQETHPDVIRYELAISEVEQPPSPWDQFCFRESDFVEGIGVLGDYRPIPDDAVELCEAEGVEWVELRVGSVAVVLLAGEDVALDCVSSGDVYALVGPESDGFETWSDAQPLAAELGSDTALPDIPLTVYGPDSWGMSFSVLNSTVIKGIGRERDAYERSKYGGGILTKNLLREDYWKNDNWGGSDDGPIIEAVRSDPTGFGWANFEAAEHAQGVKVLSVDSGQGCTAPTQATVTSGEYPALPLYLYVNTAVKEKSPHKAAYVDFLLGDLFADDQTGTVAREYDFTSLPEQARSATRAAWANA